MGLGRPVVCRWQEITSCPALWAREELAAMQWKMVIALLTLAFSLALGGGVAQANPPGETETKTKTVCDQEFCWIETETCTIDDNGVKTCTTTAGERFTDPNSTSTSTNGTGSDTDTSPSSTSTTTSTSCSDGVGSGC